MTQEKRCNDITHEEFEAKVLGNERPCLVIFWAPWCKPCRTMRSNVSDILDGDIDEAERETFAAVDIFFVNVDEQPDLAGRYRVTSIPLSVSFGAGKAVNAKVGNIPKDQFVQFVAKMTGT